MSDFWQPQGLFPTRLLCPWGFPGKNTSVDCLSLLGIFLTQGSNPCLLRYGQIVTEGFPGVPDRNPPALRVHCGKTWVRSLGGEVPLEKGMAIHCSILAWRISWTEEPGRLQSMGSQSQTRLSDFHFFLCHEDTWEAHNTVTWDKKENKENNQKFVLKNTK